MLLNLHKKEWTNGLVLKDFKEHSGENEKTIKVIQGIYLIY
jgi:26S proteasome regulatory subunit N11